MLFDLLLAEITAKTVLHKIFNILTSKFAIVVYIGIIFAIVILLVFRVMSVERRRLAEIKARQKQYEYYRDKLLTFKELKVEN